jgi:hypothetical protein
MCCVIKKADSFRSRLLNNNYEKSTYLLNNGHFYPAISVAAFGGSVIGNWFG